MKRNIQIEALDQIPLEKQRIELAERKCLGHPDSLADGIAESISQALCKTYLEEFGVVLHHNTDQGEVVAGESAPKFGGGRMIRPIYVLLDGRATKEWNGVKVPADAVAVEAANKYIHKILPDLDLNREIMIDCRLGTGSTDLRDVFKPNQGKAPRSNDTSFGVGHAPFSDVENIILNSANYIDTKLRKKYPAIGQDIKIMGLRDGNTITLTIACAIVDRYCKDIREYSEYMDILREEITAVAKKTSKRKVVVHVNTADDIKKKSVFLTVTGTSAEMGDDGSVGRGNRCNGLITPNRPMSMEATSGKNPINHIGKIYNLLSTQIAQDCVKKVDGIEEMYIRLLSQIGKPIDQPLVASVQVLPASGVKLKDINAEILGIVDDKLANVTEVTEKVIAGKLKTF
ncbi:methionine adenosyltransferase [Methanoregula formicica]|uniref:S-adenosylmethionine synthase n=1 Tax=Methanoregula formicica (strain DSM 22288 / NBRC 105244 / SMSP) TaxID=593750 RepID=L0HJ36_METFS|nr:methionine adenosyltransferase [Methanoregula formicica]AGB03318.1 archaeal S-adenosylmethionine synthetase [Methanoregula formicica SMSP]